MIFPEAKAVEYTKQADRGARCPFTDSSREYSHKSRTCSAGYASAKLSVSQDALVSLDGSSILAISSLDQNTDSKARVDAWLIAVEKAGEGAVANIMLTDLRAVEFAVIKNASEETDSHEDVASFTESHARETAQFVNTLPLQSMLQTDPPRRRCSEPNLSAVNFRRGPKCGTWRPMA